QIIEKGQVFPTPRPVQDVHDKISLLKTAAETVLFEDFFDTGGYDWAANGIWAIGTPTAGPSGAYSSPYCAATNLSGNYNNNVNDRLVSPTISLTGLNAGDTVILSFYEWYVTESGFDYGYVDISTDGGSSWTELESRHGYSDWRNTEIDLSSFIGQTVNIAFRFTSDSSDAYSGWYIDDVVITHESTEPSLTADLLSLDHGRFPYYVYSNVTLSSAELELPILSKSNFEVLENGIIQSDFSITPPETGEGVRLADIVFVLDVTGSMGEEIDSVKSNMLSFMDALAGSDVNYNVGFVTFADDYYVYNDGNLYIENDTILSIIDNITLAEHDLGYGDDTPEDQLDSMAAASMFNFREGSQKVVIMITDAYAHESDSISSLTVSSLISQLETVGMSVYPVFDIDDSAQNTQYIPIAEATNPGGKYYDVYESFSDIINDIGVAISNTYIVRYTPTNNSYDGTTRNVEIRITYSTYEASVFETYIPGSTPKIQRTAETVALHDQSWAEFTGFTIEVNVTDSYEPYTQNVMLYFRTSGTDTFSSIEMSLVSSTLYQGIIPSSLVIEPGIDYYITATDGQSSATDPVIYANSNPYQIAILPNYTPDIIHTPVTALEPGIPIQISAVITDGTNSLDSAILYYRISGQLTYSNISMPNTSGDTYISTIPSGVVTEEGIEYYIIAKDNFGVGSSSGTHENPHQITYNYTSGAITVTDIPNDQGKQVMISWEAFAYDRTGISSSPITNYSIWRKIDHDLPAVWKIADVPDGEWCFVKEVPAAQLTTYSTVVQTLADSTINNGMYYSAFFVIGHTSDPLAHYESESVVGYSVDNLSPEAVSKITVGKIPGTNLLSWDESNAEDFSHFEVHKGYSEEFVIDEATIIGSCIKPYFEDESENLEGVFYKIVSYDFSGNSNVADEIDIIAGIDESPGQFSVHSPFPNPFNPV
ncbi:VWA domain-containing protein, partial [Candidatus Latescibacterota bacterium]